MQSYDLIVISGGVNGCGIARDAAGRGLNVLLVEKADLAQATSSASTKLFHGGLRYLEFFEFRLVRESLMERERLWKAMPHISWPLRFVLPLDPAMRFPDDTPAARLLGRFFPWLKGRRPKWMIRAGLFAYDHMGGRKDLPATSTLDLTHDPAGQGLATRLKRAFEYSDCWVNDARLVVLNARDAGFAQLNMPVEAGGQGLSTIYNENLAGFHAGVRVRPFAAQSFVLYVLGGTQKDLRGTTQHRAKWFSELIAGVNGYWAWGPGNEWLESDLEAGGLSGKASQDSSKAVRSWSPRGWTPVRGRYDWFVEAGGDVAYYSRLPDGIAYLQSRQGVRFLQCGKSAAFDAYALQNLTMDTKGNYYDNYFEAGPGIRLITSPVGAAVFTTSVDYLVGSYLGRNYANTRGDTASTYSDFRITAALSLRW